MYSCYEGGGGGGGGFLVWCDYYSKLCLSNTYVQIEVVPKI